MTKQFQLGSVSTGTLDTEDLLQAFAAYLEADKEQLAAEAHGLVNRLEENYEDSIEAAGYVLEEITDALNELCPPFVYFGSHPDDGADFGFWIDQENLQNERNYHEPHDKFWLDENQCMVEFDGEDVAVFDINHNLLWSTK